MWLPYQAQEKV
ncbi:hypothetical protein LEMLEM_LOCUS5992 [Lemmus lemmus]